jgi:hypothetical protein
MATQPPPSLLKLGKPEKFNGNMRKTDTFLTQCKLYLGNNDGIYDNDKKKISYILSMMEGGTAGDWAQMKTDSYLGAAATSRETRIISDVPTIPYRSPHRFHPCRQTSRSTRTTQRNTSETRRVSNRLWIEIQAFVK